MVATAGRGWVLAASLRALVEETDRLFPNRSTASDGSIGDPAHASRESDHNPEGGWVCAVDITDDKANGCDADLLAQHIVACRDDRVKYVIWNRTIAKSYPNRGLPAWTPQPYTGVNAHEKHTHISVHNTADARTDVGPWWPQQEADMTEEQANQLRVTALLAADAQKRLERLEKRVGTDNAGMDLSDEMDGVRKALRALMVDAGLDPNSVGL